MKRLIMNLGDNEFVENYIILFLVNLKGAK